MAHLIEGLANGLQFAPDGSQGVTRQTLSVCLDSLTLRLEQYRCADPGEPGALITSIIPLHTLNHRLYTYQFEGEIHPYNNPVSWGPGGPRVFIESQFGHVPIHQHYLNDHPDFEREYTHNTQRESICVSHPEQLWPFRIALADLIIAARELAFWSA